MSSKVSVVVTTWSMNDFRSAVMRESVRTLTETAPGAEIVIVDNGGNLSDSIFLLSLAEEKKIACYVRNRHNMSFGYARNQGLDVAKGEYICIADNDIFYKQGWLEKCIEILEEYPDRKFAVTPLRADRQHRNIRHWTGEIMLGGNQKFLTNMRAGSNCWVMKREDFDKIGRFEIHRISGSRWNDKFCREGYTMVTMEENPLAQDAAFKKGYDFHAEIPNFEL